MIQKAQRTAEAPEIVDIPVPQIPQEPGSERTVDQTVDVPATIERMTPGVPQNQRLRRVVHVAVGISQERAHPEQPRVRDK